MQAKSPNGNHQHVGYRKENNIKMLTPSQTKSIELCLQLAVLVFDAMCVSFLGLVLALNMLLNQSNRAKRSGVDNFTKLTLTKSCEIENETAFFTSL